MQQAYKKTHTLNTSALRAYDIRGAIGENLFTEDAYYIGKAFATKIIEKTGKKNPTIALGRDGRLTSDALEQGAIAGIISTGANLLQIGLGPSPMLYFTVRKQNLDGGIMITGSHNPGHHNGFKMMYNKAPLFDDQIKEIGRICEAGTFAEGQGSITKIDITEEYIENLMTALQPEKSKLTDLKIAWDAGNGATGDIMVRLVKKLSGEHILLNEKIDGTFPAHHPDPTEPKNLQQLIECVLANKCDFGVAFDGDGDRIGAVDSRGRVIFGDQLLTIFAEDVLAHSENKKIIADVKASFAFSETVKKLGGEPVIWKTGHSYIKNKLAETGAPLAGEISGHIFFADRYWGFDDALYAAMRLINFVNISGKKVTEIVDSFPTAFNTPEFRLNVDEAIKFRIIDEVKIKAKEIALKTGAKISEIDGVRIDFKDGWWLLRASNTQSAVTARVEANSPENLAKLITELNDVIKPYGISV
jgi:phosphomannomutase